MMEALVRRMQDLEIGVPVRSQKIFLTSIPSAFIGYDLIEWLMEHLNIEESGEAVHLANQLCQYGYLFPVTDCKTLSVKDDNSLYRFQAAYYWPWHHRNPDNVEYSIYLVKRTLRNKQRHALEDYEVDALNSLKRNLQNKWEIVMMQAEEQIKVSKERKKMDKLVADSQERAYWRIHRPPPGYQPPLEPSPITTLRRTINAVSLNIQIETLKRQILKSRVKTSQAIEGLITYSVTYYEYDPLFTQPQPSNPWLSDDPSFWQFNLPIVENPIEKRVKRWALSFEDLLHDLTGVVEFTNYLRKEYSHENIRFWLAVQDLRHCAQSQVSIRVNTIYQEFLAHGAPCEINIDSKTQELTLNEMKQPSRFTFDAAAHHVYNALLNKDCYPRFVRSDHYKCLLANALHPPTKKRFFVFGGGGKKKSCTSTVTAVASKRRGSDRSLSGVVHETTTITNQIDSSVSPERSTPTHKELKQRSVEHHKQVSEEERHTSDVTKYVEPGPSFVKPDTIVTTVDSEEPHNVKLPDDNSYESANKYENIVVTTKKLDDTNLKITTNNQNLENVEVVEINEETSDNVKIIEDVIVKKEQEEIIVEQNVSSSVTSGGAIEKIKIGDGCESPKLEQKLSTTLTKLTITSNDNQLDDETIQQSLHQDDDKSKLQQFGQTSESIIECSGSGGSVDIPEGNSSGEEFKKDNNDMVVSMIDLHSECPEKTLQVPAGGDGVPEDICTKDSQRRADICPWEDEENCKTEEPFVKKYATLGYL